VKNWLFDVFLDKFFETDVKIRKIIADLGYKVEFPWKIVKEKVEEIACEKGYMHNMARVELATMEIKLNQQ
jgi:hypothetical protein